LSNCKLKELEKLHNEACANLVSRWRVPIAKNFAVMISSGITDKLFKKWLKKEFYPYLYLEAHNSLSSLDPGFQMKKIADLIKKDNALSKLFSSETDDSSIFKKIKNDFSGHHVTLLIFDYLKKFGSRVPNELKLETETLKENPVIFITLLRGLVKSKNVRKNCQGKKTKIKLYKKLPFFKKIFIGWLISWSQNSIRRREESRFRRALIFGYARKIFLTIGERLKQQKILEKPRDIYYLKTEEIFAITKNNREIEKIKKIIKKRKQELNDWRLIELPRRIEILTSIKEAEIELKKGHKRKKINIKKKFLKGTVVSKPKEDKIYGRALVLKEFQSDVNFNGKILVTKQTDPGWTIIFPSLKGLIVERGGMLSHAAIVARELNIPCVIGVDQATSFIRNNAEVQINLNDGKVYVKKQ